MNNVHISGVLVRNATDLCRGIINMLKFGYRDTHGIMICRLDVYSLCQPPFIALAHMTAGEVFGVVGQQTVNMKNVVYILKMRGGDNRCGCSEKYI